MGAVNPLASEERAELAERESETTEQITDLEKSVAELRKLVRELGAEIRNRFESTYTTVEAGFAEVMETLFPGGSGRLRLVEPAELVELEAGEDTAEAAEAHDGEEEAVVDVDELDAVHEAQDPH